MPTVIKQPKTRTARPNAANPAYRTIADNLRAQIAQGKLAPGAMLPSHRSLAAENGVAIGTIQQAVATLVSEGVLVTEASRGLFVAGGGRDQAPLPLTRGTALKSPATLTEKLAAHVGVIAPMAHAWPDATEYQLNDIAADLDCRWHIIHPLERFLGEQHGSASFRDIGGLKEDYAAKARVVATELIAEGVAGLVLVYLPEDVVMDVVAPIAAAANIPVVLVNSEESNIPLPRLSLDNRAAGYRAAQHLLAQGCERIVFFAPFQSAWGVARLSGIRDAVRMAGLPEDSVEVRTANCVAGDIPRFRRQDNVAADYAATLDLSRCKGAGVIAHNDYAAIGWVKSSGAVGLECGRDYLIVGFDDLEQSRLTGLSSLHPPLTDLGIEAGKMLMDSMATGSGATKRILLNSHLVIRDSSRLRIDGGGKYQ